MLTKQSPTLPTVLPGLTNAATSKIYTPNWKETLGKYTVFKVSDHLKTQHPRIQRLNWTVSSEVHSALHLNNLCFFLMFFVLSNCYHVVSCMCSFNVKVIFLTYRNNIFISLAAFFLIAGTFQIWTKMASLTLKNLPWPCTLLR